MSILQEAIIYLEYSWKPLEPHSPFIVQDQLHTPSVFEAHRQTQATTDVG